MSSPALEVSPPDGSRSDLGWRLGEGKVHVFWAVEAQVGGRTVGRGGVDQESDGKAND